MIKKHPLLANTKVETYVNGDLKYIRTYNKNGYIKSCIDNGEMVSSIEYDDTDTLPIMIDTLNKGRLDIEYNNNKSVSQKYYHKLGITKIFEYNECNNLICVKSYQGEDKSKLIIEDTFKYNDLNLLIYYKINNLLKNIVYEEWSEYNENGILLNSRNTVKDSFNNIGNKVFIIYNNGNIVTCEKHDYVNDNLHIIKIFDTGKRLNISESTTIKLQPFIREKRYVNKLLTHVSTNYYMDGRETNKYYHYDKNNNLIQTTNGNYEYNAEYDSNNIKIHEEFLCNNEIYAEYDFNKNGLLIKSTEFDKTTNSGYPEKIIKTIIYGIMIKGDY